MNPLLFNVYMADIEEIYRNRNIEGLRICNLRIWNLAYADDMEIRKLQLCTETAKILVFNRKKREVNLEVKRQKD